MSGRNFNASSSMLKCVIFLYFALLSSNCNAYPSLLTENKGENKEKTSVTEALQNIIMRQFTLISECMSQKNSDVRKDVLINKKKIAQTQTELMIMKEENIQLKEELLKIKIEFSECKVTTYPKWARQDTGYKIQDIKELTGMYENKTQELVERLDKQDDRIEQRHSKQNNDNVRLKNVLNQLKDSHNSLQESHHSLQESHNSLNESYDLLKESHQNASQKLTIQLKELDGIILNQKRAIEKLQEESKENQRNISDLKTLQDSLRTDFQVHERQHLDVDNRQSTKLNSSEVEVRDLQNKYSSMQTDLNVLKTLQDSLRTDLQAHQRQQLDVDKTHSTKLNSSEAEVRDLQTKYSSIQTEINEIEDMQGSLRTDLQVYQKQQLDLDNRQSTKINRSEADIRDLQTKYSSIQKEINKGCERDWQQYNGSCYRFSGSKGTYQWAKRWCTDVGGYLVRVDSKEENDWLKLQMRVQDLDDLWIGATDVSSEGTFKWESNNTPITYSDWASGQPDNANGEEHYVHLHKGIGYKWNDHHSRYKCFSVCEK